MRGSETSTLHLLKKKKKKVEANKQTTKETREADVSSTYTVNTLRLNDDNIKRKTTRPK